MDIKLNKLDGLHRELLVKVLASEIEEVYNKKLKQLQQKTKLDGFRPGHVPIKIIEKRYRENIEGEVKEEILRDALHKSLHEHNLSFAYDPILTSGDFDLTSDVGLKFKFEILPEFKIHELKDFEYSEPKPEISKELVAEKIKELELDICEYKELKDTAPLKYDRMHVKLIGKDKDVIIFNPQKEEKFFFVGLNHILPELEAKIIKLKLGESTSLSHTYPADFHDQSLANKQVDYECELIKIMQPQKLEWTENDFKKVSPSISSYQDLEAYIKNYLTSHELSQQLTEARQNIKKYLLESLDFEVPEKIVAETLSYTKKNDKDYTSLNNLIDKAKQDKENTIKFKRSSENDEKIIKTTDAEKELKIIEKSLHTESLRQNRFRYYVSKIASLQKIEPDDNRVAMQFNDIIKQLNMPQDNFIKSDLGKRFYQNLLLEDVEKQVLDWHLNEKIKVAV